LWRGRGEAVMAYGLKYLLRYSIAKTNQDVKIKIYEKDYVGATFPKKIGASKIVLSKQKDEKICGTSLDFAIQADTDFEYTNFFNGDNKTHYVEMLIEDFVAWAGYIVSDQYSEPYVAPPYDVEVLCTDGLGLLKTEDFTLAGYVSRFAAIRYCLDKIGLNLGYQINLDLWEINMNPALHNMLDQLYFQAEIFDGENCYDVIQKLLPEGATITQHDRAWLIERSADVELISGTPDYISPKPRWLFDANGVSESSSVPPVIYEIGTIAEDKTRPVGNLTMNFRPAWKNFDIEQIFGKKESFLLNYEFKKGTVSWAENGGTGFFKTLDLKSGSFALINGTQTTISKYISQSVEVTPADNVVVSIDYSPIGYSAPENLPGLSPISTDVYFEVKLTGGGNTYYLNNTGWNLNAQKYIKIEAVESSTMLDAITWKTYLNVCKKFPVPGTLTVKLFQRYSTTTPPARNHVNFYGIAVKNVLVYTENISLFNDTETTHVILADNATEEGETIELMPTDLPEYDNAKMYFLNGNYTGATIAAAVPTSKWGATQARYIEYMSAFMSNQNGAKRATLSGTLTNSYGLHLNMFFIHELNNNKVFTIETGSWNVLDHTIDVTLLEVAPIYNMSVVVTPEPFNPETVFVNNPDLADWTSVGNEGSYTKAIDGSFEHILTGTSLPMIISRKETITPYQLDYDSGTPQFSIKGMMVETNIGGNPNILNIDAGAIISHHFYAQNRAEIALLKE